MNKNIQTVLHYHETTKHSQQRYARSLGYMNWATQPNPFREYEGTTKIKLPLALSNTTPPYSLLDSDLPSAPLVLESISQLLQFSMGLAAWKESGGSSWAVRCNASSGNLHSTEAYLVLPPVLDKQSGIYHYAPKNHELESLAAFDTNFWQTLERESFIVGLSSVVWREVWKYGERAFRYTQLDAGHAWQSFVVSAKLLGWDITRLDNVSHNDITRLLGLNQEERFFEDEIADMLLLVSPNAAQANISLDALLDDIPPLFEGNANKLSPSMYDWEIISSIEKATSVNQVVQQNVSKSEVPRVASLEAKEVILNRRSIHVMDKQESYIAQEQFHTLLESVVSSLDGKANATHLVIFVHRVYDYKSGLYILLRNDDDLENLQTLTKQSFYWRASKFENLYFLQDDDFNLLSKSISCNQDIACDGAFSLGMLSRYTHELQTFGAHRYKELYWECGAIGQQLYLEATSMGLSGTGIGCFLDDMMHHTLGLQTNEFQTLYHFTVGRGYIDSRIQTKAPY